MPANSSDFYLQDARNNFDSVRPAPFCTEANQVINQCPNVHISTNCYYGYHGTKNTRGGNITNDYEMLELPVDNTIGSMKPTTRKRGAEGIIFSQNKRFREEVQRKKTIEPETNETVKSNLSAEHLLESLYWNIHGGNLYNLK